MIRCIVVSELELESIKEFTTPETFYAYRDGVSYGSGMYGGDAYCYTLDDLKILDETDDYDLKIIKLIEANLK